MTENIDKIKQRIGRLTIWNIYEKTDYFNR